MYTLKEIDANRLNKPDGNEKTLFLDQEDYKLKTKDGNGVIEELAVVDENASTPLVYKALLTQTGTDAPVATVLENTLGGTPVWSYSSTGSYTLTLSGVFTENRTTFPTNGTILSAALPAILRAQSVNWVNVNEVNLQSYDSVSEDTFNNELNNTFFEIQVYP